MKGRAVRRRLYLGALLTSVAFLGFLAGAYVVRFKKWPYPLVWDVFVAVGALEVHLMPAERFGHSFYTPVSTSETGVRRHDPSRTYDGLTLFTSGHAQRAYLISMAGEIRHEWHLPFSQVWTDPPQLDGARTPDHLIAWRKAHLFPNGDLLAIYVGVGVPWGYGLAKMDKDSRLLWKYDRNVHHDVTVGDDGTIYTLTHDIVTDPIVGLEPDVTPPLIEDYLVSLSADGQELKRRSLSSLIRNSRFASLMQLPTANLKGDLWHANNVEPLPATAADRFPFLEPGQLLVSLLGIDCLAIVDWNEETVVWAMLGPWRAQHDPDFLDNGNMLLFDNRGHLGPGGRSRVLEFDPASLEIVWQYAGTADEPLDSDQRASQQRLPNGNTLITDSYSGRIIEVTREQDIVWEYLSPFRAAHDPKLVGYTQWAKRFDPEALRFELTGPVED